MRSAADLFIGAACSGCGRAGYVLCPRCRGLLRIDPQNVELDPTPLELSGTPVWACGPYRCPLRGTLIDFKEQGKFSLMPILGYHLASSIAAAAGDAAAITVVPIPSRTVATVKRGYDVVYELAAFAAGALRCCGLSIRVDSAVGFTRAVSDQGSLTGRQRRRNMHGVMRASRRCAGAIVVDDIVTTGSTVGEAVRALEQCGSAPLAVAAVATTAEQWRWQRSPFDVEGW